MFDRGSFQKARMSIRFQQKHVSKRTPSDFVRLGTVPKNVAVSFPTRKRPNNTHNSTCFDRATSQKAQKSTLFNQETHPPKRTSQHVLTRNLSKNAKVKWFRPGDIPNVSLHVSYASLRPTCDYVLSRASTLRRKDWVPKKLPCFAT